MTEFSKTVLIVDDEMIIRQSFIDYFEDYLWKTLQAESEEQALEILEKESPDAAIVDIRMGGGNGDNFIRAAHRMKPKMVFVIFTGSPEYEAPEDLMKIPNVSKQVFKKPVSDMSVLEKEIIKLMSLIQEVERRG